MSCTASGRRRNWKRSSGRWPRLRIAVAMGIFAREHLAGVMLLGPRLSGRIYGSVEQNALQVLCGQLAIAIDNAQLFTEVQNAKIYNEILLQNLTTGVIAADADGRITVFNNEAEQITGSKSADLLDRSIDGLPDLDPRPGAGDAAFQGAPGKSRAYFGLGRRRRGGAREQLDLSWATGPDAGGPRGSHRYHGAETPRAPDPAQRPARKSRHAFRRHGARDQEPARFDQDFRPALAGTLSRLRFPRNFLEPDRP